LRTVAAWNAAAERLKNEKKWLKQP
jgi:hypothetical protein